jgi:hypothetical protein
VHEGVSVLDFLHDRLWEDEIAKATVLQHIDLMKRNVGVHHQVHRQGCVPVVGKLHTFVTFLFVNARKGNQKGRQGKRIRTRNWSKKRKNGREEKPGNGQSGGRGAREVRTQFTES